MKYMLILSGEEGGMEDVSPEEMKAVMDRWSAFGQELVDAGAIIPGEGLQESATATTVRIPLQGGGIEVRPVMDYAEYGYEDPSAAAAEASS